MSDKAFIDTNVLLYLYSEDEEAKRLSALNAVNKYDCYTSTQALNEFSSVCTRKWKLPAADIQKQKMKYAPPYDRQINRGR